MRPPVDALLDPAFLRNTDEAVARCLEPLERDERVERTARGSMPQPWLCESPRGRHVVSCSGGLRSPGSLPRAAGRHCQLQLAR